MIGDWSFYTSKKTVMSQLQSSDSSQVTFSSLLLPSHSHHKLREIRKNMDYKKYLAKFNTIFCNIVLFLCFQLFFRKGIAFFWQNQFFLCHYGLCVSFTKHVYLCMKSAYERFHKQITIHQ